ncbi:MAG: ZIP family metal transporter [Candidatus Pacebacteria bacterium]|jgi:zinc and cadmium transporter|nr:ZIP family metal transporter [bacterium]MDP6527946.1 ZIP family metal transporter [Candidatus Paceibacterota bacterium]MDP6659477.1 ZIP family metal transporter [Candidatus Paceibacterota bacterium]|tara:strand:- start:7296 stop:8045 length:750 start_codon:yes stop_codon:yes gene_type:complete
MPEIYVLVIGSVFLVSLISLVGIFTLSFRTNVLERYVFVFVSLAVGALLGDAFIHLIPESFEALNDTTLTSLLIILGLFIFFVLEKVLHWNHDHRLPKSGHSNLKPLGTMALTSDGIHNFLDGLIIGASYLVSVEVGIATTIAVMLHEIPQEIGDFGVLLHAGYSKMRALALNFFSGLLAVLGAIVVLVFGATSSTFISYIIPIAAGGFIYIAVADLIPELQKVTRIKSSLIQVTATLVGVLVMGFLAL